MFKKNLLIAFSLSFALIMSGCAFEPEPIDHQAQACSATNDILDAMTAVPGDNGEDENISDIEDSNAILAGTLAVWESDGGTKDSTFKLLSKYEGKLFRFFYEGSPSAAKALTDFEEKYGSKILDQCGITSVEYVKPLEIQGGCFTTPDVNGQLQEKINGSWARDRAVQGLSKTPRCSDPKFPWSVNFKITRGFTSTKEKSKRVGEYRIVWTLPEGRYWRDGSNALYYCVDVSRSGNDYLELSAECK